MAACVSLFLYTLIYNSAKWREYETGRTSRAESEAAVAAMQAKPKEERHATANAELGARPNYDMGAVANGAPPQTTIWGLPTHIWTSGSAIDA